MSEIAKASGVAKSLIHHHFGTKEALWEEVKRTCFTEYHAQQKKLLAGGAPTPQTARASMQIYFEFLCERPQVLRLMWWMLLGDDDDRSNPLVTELGELGVSRIRDLQRSGALRSDVRPESILAAFLGLIHAAFTEEWLLKHRGIDASAYLDDVWKLFASGVVLEADEPAD